MRFSKMYGLSYPGEGIFSKMYGLSYPGEGTFSKMYGLAYPGEGTFSRIFISFWVIEEGRFVNRNLQKPIWEISLNINS
jgi:hypothetical protein